MLALAGGLAARAEPDILRTARAVRELSEKEANRPYRAEISGVVLGLAEPYGSGIVVQDATDPIYITGPSAMIGSLAPGDLVQVRGSSDAGGFAPCLRADEIRKTGEAAVPEPQRVSVAELYSIALDAHWISVTGVVQSMRDLAADEIQRGLDLAGGVGAPIRRVKMTLAVADRLVPVQLYGTWNAERYVDAEVEVRGLCFSQHNPERQYMNVLVLVPLGTGVRVVREQPREPFDMPAASPRSLFGFNRAGISQHRVRVDGVVLHQVDEAGFWIRDDSTGLFVQGDTRTPLVPGDRVQVAGFQEHGAFSSQLAHALFRKIAHGPDPVPTRITDRATAARHDGDLVVVEGVLAGQKESDEGLVLRIDWQGTEVPAVYRRHPGDTPGFPSLEIGSLLSVTGICMFSSARDAPLSGVLTPDKFSVLLRGAPDLAVLRPAPWWTARRLTTVLGAMIALLAAILVTVFVVARRKLARERSRRAAEIAEYSARLTERSHMARNLHDTIAQGLGAISLQLELAANGTSDERSASASHLAMALQLVRTSMVEVRSFIRNLRTKTQQDVELTSALEELLQTVTKGTSIEPKFHLRGTVRKFPPGIEAQIIRITQEAIANCVQHSGAEAITVNLYYDSAGVVVTIADNGAGFDHAADWGEKLHFGLLGMKERADLISSTLTIAAPAGGGTQVTLQVPRDAAIKDSLSL